MDNERETSRIIREIFTDLNKNDKHFVLEEEDSSNKRISELLGRKQPDFIGSHKKNNNLVILIEAKASSRDHKKGEEQVKGYAALLKSRFDVVAIAISGTSKTSIETTTFIYRNELMVNYHDDALRSFLGYKKFIKPSDSSILAGTSLKSLAKSLNEFMYGKMSLVENRRPLLISGILIALTDPIFRESYKKYDTSDKLVKGLSTALENVLHENTPEYKIANLLTEFGFIRTYKTLRDSNNLLQLIETVDNRVYESLANECDYDIIGEFYSEFLSYVGGDQKALGIVLTPKHITELMVDLVYTNVNTVLIDTCAGTGGFLVSGMNKMLRLAKRDEEIRSRIKKNQLIGIELQSHMYALAVSNMLIRGDGKANMTLGSCFMSDPQKKSIVDMGPTAGTINPPYLKDNTELRFADNMLDLLTTDSYGAVILPISCAIKPSEMKKTILKKHTLEAVMSMPTDLFQNAGVVTCIMVFKAKKPHQSDHKTWFGYWRDDGFVKTRVDGRADINNTWGKIKKEWCNYYKYKKVEAGKSVLKKVTADDEWCVEAYMETDYTAVSNEDFVKDLKAYVAWEITNG